MSLLHPQHKKLFIFHSDPPQRSVKKGIDEKKEGKKKEGRKGGGKEGERRVGGGRRRTGKGGRVRSSWQLMLVLAPIAPTGAPLPREQGSRRSCGVWKGKAGGRAREISKSVCLWPSMQTVELGAKVLILDLLHTC